MVRCCWIGLLGMPPLHDSPELSPPVSCTHAAGAGGGQRLLNLAPSCASAPQDFQEWGSLFEVTPFGRGFESAVDPFFEHLQARSLSLSPIIGKQRRRPTLVLRVWGHCVPADAGCACPKRLPCLPEYCGLGGLGNCTASPWATLNLCRSSSAALSAWLKVGNGSRSLCT